MIKNNLLLPLSAKERTQLRGKRSTLDGIDVILNLPRGGGRLIPGEVLKSENSKVFVSIVAAHEDVIRISSENRLKLLKAAYHLGNRHVEVEIKNNILLTKGDYVIENMLKNFDVEVKNIMEKFFPETGAHNHE